MKYFISILILFILISLVFTNLMGGPITILLSMMDIHFIIFPATFIMAWAVSPKKSFSNSCSLIFTNKDLDEKDFGNVIHYLKAARSAGLLSSFLAVLLGIIKVLSSVSEGAEVIGHHFAGCLVGLVDAVVLWFVFRMAQFYIEGKR